MREAEMRASGNLYRIIITWKTEGANVRVNLLDERTREPLTKQRTYSSEEHVRGLVGRSMTSLGGPRPVTFGQALDRGFGEIEVNTTRVQYERLRDS
jgi:hypothetical protein